MQLLRHMRCALPVRSNQTRDRRATHAFSRRQKKLPNINSQHTSQSPKIPQRPHRSRRSLPPQPHQHHLPDERRKNSTRPANTRRTRTQLGPHQRQHRQRTLPMLRVCETKLPPGAMQVRKFLSGKITINQNKCPTNCTDCLDVCPITGALHLSKIDNKVHTNETFCVYCGACKTVCPVDDALELKRTRIDHSPVRSGAWNKALERLTSSTDMTKELKTKGSAKARESVMRRMRLEEEQNA